MKQSDTLYMNAISNEINNISTMEINDSTSPFVISFCSGKGGVGKSVLAVNLGISLAKYGRVLIWDTNIHFPNVHLMIGAEPPVRLNEVYTQQIDASQAVCDIDENISILAGSPAEPEENRFIENKVFITFEQLLNYAQFDFIIIDAPAGYSEDILQCCSISDIILLTMTDEPTSMLDAYGLLKIMKRKIDFRKMHLLINNVIDNEDAEEVIEKFNMVTNKFLNLQMPEIGFIPYDRSVRQSILMQEVLVKTKPDGESSKAIERLANRIFELHVSSIEQNVGE